MPFSASEWWRLRCRALSTRGEPLAGGGSVPGNSSAPALADSIRLRCPGSAPVATLREGGGASADGGWGPPMIVATIERVQSGFIGETLSSVGITGLYVTLVFGLGRFLRLSINNLRMRIPYQDLPDVRHLWTLCSDITIAREEKEFMLEEQLFYSLINIYRSPSVLFELTKKDL
jgi:piezo-type mechanosensitive ion channel component 1/2